jgi:ribonuclease P protein component
VLPEPYRLHHRADFSRTVRHGRRVGRHDLVVHVFAIPTELEAERQQPTVRSGGPRFGLIVSKAVGNAVVRHRTARRLRHICAGVADELPPGVDIVIRALSGAASAASAELEPQLRSALQKVFPDLDRSPESGGPP